MRYLRYLVVLLALAVPASFAHAQIGVGIGVGIDPGYGYDYYGAAPVCSWGYYSYYPYACAPYGYYGPSWFLGGVFIGAAPGITVIGDTAGTAAAAGAGVVADTDTAAGMDTAGVMDTGAVKASTAMKATAAGLATPITALGTPMADPDSRAITAAQLAPDIVLMAARTPS